MRLTGQLRPALLGIACSALGTAAVAAPMTYEIDPNHTYPTFEADHLGGLSFWRGKINSSSGTITLDQEAGTGTVNVVMNMDSIDFGHDGLNDHAKTPDLFDVAKYPTATYTGTLAGFQNGSPTRVDGTLTLHGVTKPVTLNIDMFTCKPHPFTQQPVCGANATAQIDRSDFGINFGEGVFKMGVLLRISVEAALKQ